MYQLPVQLVPTGGSIGPTELADLLPLLERAGWFFGGTLIVILIGFYLVVPAISRIVSRRNANNPTLEEAISRYVQLLFVIVGVLVGITLAGYGQIIASSTLVVAAATLAIGVAGQAVIGSIFSGMVLVADPEFNVGAYIRWDGGEGVVKSITLRVTRVETPDGKLVTIPNTKLTAEPVTRPFGKGRYRAVEQIGLAYEADVDEAIDECEKAATEVEEIMENPPIKAFVDEFGSDAVVLRIHYWISDPRRRNLFTVRSMYAKTLKRRLEQADISIAPASKRELLGRIELEESAKQ